MAASEIEKLERLVRENPKGRLFASLADAYRKAGQYPKALEVLEAGLKNHPEYVSARVVLGRVQMAIGDRVKAREAFSRVVELDPESVIALKALADLAEEEGESSEALRWSGQLLTVDPGNEDAQKQIDRLGILVQAHGAMRLSGIVPVQMEGIAEIQAPMVEIRPPTEQTEAPFKAVQLPVAKTVEIPVVSAPSARPSFSPVIAPLDQAPEPLPLMPLSQEAQTEQTAGDVRQMAAFEPTSFEGGGDAPTARMAGIDPVGLTAEEVAGISATPGFEPNSDDIDATSVPRHSLPGLETISGELVLEADAELEWEVELELSAGATNEFQESSAAETLQRRSGTNEFQVSSDADTLDMNSAAGTDSIDTGGMDLAFIEPSPELRASKPVPFIAPAAMVPEDPEPAVAEPEPVVTEAMAELYSSQGHLVEALDVYRQLSARSPDDPRFTDRIVELEIFVGGAAPVKHPPATGDIADSLDEMELTPPPAPAPGATAPAARVTVGSWLADIFAEAIPGAEVEPPQSHEARETPEVAEVPAPAPLAPAAPAAPVASVPTSAPVSDAAPLGSPTRQASGRFSLSNVFHEGNQGAPTAKTGSFDAFFGAPTASTPAAPASASPPAGPSTHSTRPAASAPLSDDDLSGFRDWLQGLKK